MDPRSWLEAYGKAWRLGDDELVHSLFTEDAIYRSHPLRDPLQGPNQIGDYWRQVTATQANLDLRFGEPVVSGHRMAVEWWATMHDEGEWVTIPGCLVLAFAPDGRCRQLREYWHVESSRVSPPAGWGT